MFLTEVLENKTTHNLSFMDFFVIMEKYCTAG
jgi:hypothetical protein